MFALSNLKVMLLSLCITPGRKTEQRSVGDVRKCELCTPVTSLFASCCSRGLMLLWGPHVPLGASCRTGGLLSLWGPHVTLGASCSTGGLVFHWGPPVALGASSSSLESQLSVTVLTDNQHLTNHSAEPGSSNKICQGPQFGPILALCKVL